MDISLALKGSMLSHQQTVQGFSHTACMQQATNASAPNAKDNGAKMNGSSPANQPGQAAAPKAPGEAPPKAKAKSKGFNNVNKYVGFPIFLVLFPLNRA